MFSILMQRILLLALIAVQASAASDSGGSPECPDSPLYGGEPCALDPSVTCELDFELDCPVYLPDGVIMSKQSCICNTEGEFECEIIGETECPRTGPCPEVRPNENDACELFGVGLWNGISEICTYDEFCCPGGDCVPDVVCYCGIYDKTVACFEEGALSCPSVCPLAPPAESSSCDIDERFRCEYGECPYDSSLPRTLCDCEIGEWYCYQSCPSCPYDKPSTGSPCVPELTTESCSYDEVFCSGVFDSQNTCHCNPDTKAFECTTIKPKKKCPSSACPAKKPSEYEFCDEPFGPGIFDDAISKICTYGDEICCPSTGECAPEAICGCYLEFSEVYCSEEVLDCPDFCPDAPPMNGTSCDVRADACRYGDCPYYSSSSLMICGCSDGLWSCNDDCPDCPYYEPATGDPCFPELTAGECCYGGAKYCSGVFQSCERGCQCNPGTGVFECSTKDAQSPIETETECPSATCPDVKPSHLEFCGEPFGPGYFDYISENCTYGDEVCCPSTGECVAASSCGCDLSVSLAFCEEPFIYDCPDFCPDTPPTDEDACNFYGFCFYNFDSCFGPEISTYDCLCQDGMFTCYDYCSDSPSTPAPSPPMAKGMKSGVKKGMGIKKVSSMGMHSRQTTKKSDPRKHVLRGR